MRKLLKSKMKGVPEDQQDKMIDAMEKNPELFKKIADETQALMKSGKDQMAAAMEVMGKYKDELAKVMK